MLRAGSSGVLKPCGEFPTRDGAAVQGNTRVIDPFDRDLVIELSVINRYFVRFKMCHPIDVGDVSGHTLLRGKTRAGPV